MQKTPDTPQRRQTAPWSEELTVTSKVIQAKAPNSDEYDDEYDDNDDDDDDDDDDGDDDDVDDDGNRVDKKPRVLTRSLTVLETGP